MTQRSRLDLLQGMLDRLDNTGRKQLRLEGDQCDRFAAAIGRVFGPRLT
jgi:hypothetical protein